MVNKCAAPSCQSGYTKIETKQITQFHFPLKNLWIVICGFYLSTANIGSQQNTVLCELHFEEKYNVRGGKSNLKWLMNPIPTKHSKQLLKMPSSLLLTSKTTQKPPRQRLISNDQMDRWTISTWSEFNKNTKDPLIKW